MPVRPDAEWEADGSEELTLDELGSLVQTAHRRGLPGNSKVRADVKASFKSPAPVKRLVVG